MVSFPYPKLMNANDRVDQGAALILCSLGAARDAGVPSDRLVFPVSGTDAHDHWFLSDRENLRSSPAIGIAGRRALSLAGLGVDDVAHVDLYSCFPCAVQIAAHELGLALDDPGRSLTVTGGLGFAGGPGNNYVSHSIASMAERLRADPGSTGLVTGLGWYSTKHAVGVWSTTPPATGFRHESPRPTWTPSLAAPPHRTTKETPRSRPTPWCTTGRAGHSSPSWPCSPTTNAGPGPRSPTATT